MAYSRTSDYRYKSGNRLNTRYKGVLVLIGAIIFGMIISAAVNAIPSGKSQSVATKTVDARLK